MSVKVMGISAGRANSNSEILLKEALLVCQESGADVTMINLRDYNILDCTGCTACTIGMSQGKNVGCVLDKKDDKKKIMEVMLDCDAVIFSSPTYDLMSCSTFAKFAQRSLSYETAFLETIKAIEHKDRVSALIAVGGSTRSWQSMALESMQAAMFTTDMQVIDMYLATRVPAPAQCLLHDEMLERARKVGKNIMTAVKTAPKDRKWLGDEDMGWCPNCHSNALVLGEVQWDGLYFPVECQVCGAGGNLEQTQDKKWKFVIQEDGLCRDRTTVEGRAKHLEEIAHTQGGFFQNPVNREIVNEKLVKYKNIQFKSI
ncbi:flavodoxin family protein [Candidatus Galacturonibacter soehngenii]|uniref:Flavodoxin family protein n=1 Tax=Candidatus Galacturonatibacter soehngenii TaxID=2307010 RepID=A0A7V7QKR1_9FIRM|nr:flavodoxin family protein [Candidatus Galacturonibacter soehngenii]KAB1438429.1 flavodoxin family protein [Candidatus Galacturonibacter soehngenii]